MAEENAQERTEAATPKRQEDARKKGQVARSRELSTSALLLVSASLFYVFADHIYQNLSTFLYAGLHLSTPEMTDSGDLLRHFARMLMMATWMTLPYFLILLVAVIASGLMVGGWVFSTQSLIPDFTKLDPISGAQKIISKHGALELVKSSFENPGDRWLRGDPAVGAASRPVRPGSGNPRSCSFTSDANERTGFFDPLRHHTVDRAF